MVYSSCMAERARKNLAALLWRTVFRRSLSRSRLRISISIHGCIWVSTFLSLCRPHCHPEVAPFQATCVEETSQTPQWAKEMAKVKHKQPAWNISWQMESCLLCRAFLNFVKTTFSSYQQSHMALLKNSSWDLRNSLTLRFFVFSNVCGRSPEWLRVNPS